MLLKSLSALFLIKSSKVNSMTKEFIAMVEKPKIYGVATEQMLKLVYLEVVSPTKLNLVVMRASLAINVLSKKPVTLTCVICASDGASTKSD